MTTHNAIKESIREIVSRVSAAEANRQNDTLQEVLKFLDETSSGATFNQTVKCYLQPVATQIAAKDIVSIAEHYKTYNLKELHDNVSEQDMAAIWQQLGMTNMLLTTMDMIPPEMLGQIESMTNTMMGVLQSGMSGSGHVPDLSALTQGLSGMFGPSNIPTSTREQTRARGKGKGKKKEEFRDKLC